MQMSVSSEMNRVPPLGKCPISGLPHLVRWAKEGWHNKTVLTSDFLEVSLRGEGGGGRCFNLTNAPVDLTGTMKWEGGYYWECARLKPRANIDSHLLCGQWLLQSHLQFHIYHSLRKQQWTRAPQAPAVSRNMRLSVVYKDIVWSYFLRQNSVLPEHIVLLLGKKKKKKAKCK